ncbi:hypothetical protein ACFC4C_33480 [Streptomyces sp. NPDC056039]|uniref:hypothetical protein n=1 Tax=Streptomyces sp. NPDC056039 TaxID=3345687 RepID=UPI0035DA6B68
MHRHFRDEALGTACSVHDLVVLFEGAGVHAAGQARGSIRAASTSALTSFRARPSGSCAMTSSASSSNTTPYRIPHTPV